MTEVLAAYRLCKQFGNVKALDQVTFVVHGPALVGILGPNGSGKTTLLDILEGLSDPTSGEARVLGQPLSPYPRHRVGAVLQREFVLDRVTVREYAQLFSTLHNVSHGDDRIIKDANLEARANVAVERISGGEAQRLFIAAAGVHDPDLLFLDEPTAHMDPENRERIKASLVAMSKSRTVVMATHDLDEAEAICDVVLFLSGGSVRAIGTVKELVDAVPLASRDGLRSAYFHYCATQIDARGDTQGALA